MKDYIVIGSAPYDEECAQVGSTDYYEKMKLETAEFIKLIRRNFGEEPECARLAVKGFPHDFGTYYEVVCYYDPDNEEAKNYAFECEAGIPVNWDDDTDLPWLVEERNIAKNKELRFKHNMEHVEALTQGQIVRYIGYRDFNSEEIYHNFGNFRDVKPHDMEATDELFFQTNISGSDYSGSLVDKANYDEFLETFEDIPGVYKLSGGYDSFGIILKLDAIDNDEIWETLKKLEDYCLIDDETLSKLETEAEDEAWIDWVAQEFAEGIGDEGVAFEGQYYKLDFDDIENSVMRELFEKLRERANEEWFTENMDRTICVENIVKHLKIEDVYDINGVRWLVEDEDEEVDVEVSKPFIDRCTANMFEGIENE